MVQMIPLSRVAPADVEDLLDAAFGADRKSRTAYKLRAGTQAVEPLSFAAVDGASLIGSIQCWPVALVAGGTHHPLILVGPIAVSPDAQGKGLGKALVSATLEAAELGCYDALMMIGDPDYYGRFFAFTADATGGWEVPGPVERHRLLARMSRVNVPTNGMLVPDPGGDGRL